MMIYPVCKMNAGPGKEAVKTEYAGQVYYFCSDTCHKAFVAEPEKYASGAAPTDHSCSATPLHAIHVQRCQQQPYRFWSR